MNFNNHDVDNNALNNSPDTGAGDDVSMPLGTGEFGEQGGLLTQEEPSRKLNSGAILIVFIVLIAAAGLFSMRTLTRVTAADDEPQAIAQSIDAFLTEVINQDGSEGRTTKLRVLDVLNESYAERQVPLDEVKRNPFILFEAKHVDGPAPTAQQDPMIARRQARLAEFEKAAERLNITMIMMGSNPLANVNNRVVTVGDVIPVEGGIDFRVVSIAQDSVVCVAEDAELGIEHHATLTIRRN